ATRPNLEVWYSHLDLAEALSSGALGVNTKIQLRTQKAVDKARTRDSLQALGKLTKVVDGRARIVKQPLVVPVEDLFEEHDAEAIYAEIRALVAAYSRTLQGDRRHLLAQYRFVQMAR